MRSTRRNSTLGIVSTHMLIPFIMAGAGMSLVFAPSANAVLSSVPVSQAGAPGSPLAALAGDGA